MSSLLLALILTADAGTPLDAGTSLEATRARALQLYNTLKYDQACPLMKEVAEQLKTDSGAWSDLGLCLIRSESPRRPPAAAREALLRAWSLATTASLRSAAVFNLSLFYSYSGDGPTLLTDPRCPDAGVLLSSIPVVHYSVRTSANTYELTACAPGSDGGCIAGRTSRLSLGGQEEEVEPMLPPACYPETQEQLACAELLRGEGLSKAEKAAVAKAGSCEAIMELPVFKKRMAKLDRECDQNMAGGAKYLQDAVNEAPRWRLQLVDVCAEKLRATWGKKRIEFKLGNQTDEMGAQEVR